MQNQPAEITEDSRPHAVSVVIPVYGGEKTLDQVVQEIKPLVSETLSPGGNNFRVEEVLLVFDHGPDDSAATIRRLSAQHEFVRPVWLSRTFGKHSATLAGMAARSAARRVGKKC